MYHFLKVRIYKIAYRCYHEHNGSIHKGKKLPVSGLKSCSLLQGWEIHVFIIMIYSIFKGLVIFKSAAYLKKKYIFDTRIILDCKIKQIHLVQHILQKQLLGGKEKSKNKLRAQNPLHRSCSCKSI